MDPSVAAKDCGNLSVPRNGTIIGNETTYPNDLLFACDDGFNLIGSTVRSCQADSEWSGNETYCEGIVFSSVCKEKQQQQQTNEKLAQIKIPFGDYSSC